MPHINASLAAAAAAGRSLPRGSSELPLIEKMISEGYTGRKGKGGFYRINRDGGQGEGGDRPRHRRVPAGAQARDRGPEASASSRALLEHDSPHGRYAWRVLGPTLAYAAALVGDAADDIQSIDEAMRLGYNWKFGPFELIDQLGPAWLTARLEADGAAVAPLLRIADGRPFYRVHEGRRQALGLDGAYHDVVRPEGVVMLEDLKLDATPVLKNGSAALWDIGDGVACLEFTSKMNALDPDTMDLLMRAIHRVAQDFKALVIYNEGTNFSVGANLGLALFAANIAAWSEIENLVAQGQATYRVLKYAPFPVVGAPSGMALGGGCEILLHCDAVQAHAETYMGLVEVGVGLIPGWGGCKEMLQRWFALGRLPKGPMPPIAKAFETISTATVAKSAAEAKELLFLHSTDGVTMNRYRLLADAKAKALQLAKNYKPPEPQLVNLPGPSARVAMEMAVDGFARLGKATPYDKIVSGALAEVLSGGDTDITEAIDEDGLLKLERESFRRLVRRPETLARIEHMLTTSKPLRN